MSGRLVTSVEVCSREFAYPDECPCCGAAADGERAIRLHRSERTVGTDTARSVLFPYCRRCIEHVDVWEAGSMLSAVLVLAGAACALVSVAVGHVATGLALFAGGLALATLVTAMFRARARAACGPSCADASAAVAYDGWSGSTSAFRFASPTYAARFAEHNQHQLVNVDAMLRALLERHARVRLQVPTPAAPYRVMPPPLSADGWLDQIADQPSRVARRMVLRRALDAGHDDTMQSRLVALVCESELSPLQAELAGKSSATRRRRVDETLRAVRADNLPRPLQRALVEALLDLRRDRQGQGT